MPSIPSFNVINYSLRPNKSIQRSIVFEGMKELRNSLDLGTMLYVGFGSVWFTDFNLAHKFLGIEDMVSIEGDKIGAARANYNKPFRTVVVCEGDSAEVLPELLDDAQWNARPWFVWLDYDQTLSQGVVEDLRIIIERSAPNSALVVTLSTVGLGSLKNRPERLKKLLGGVVPDDLSKDDCEDDKVPHTLARLLEDFMVSAATSAARQGGFVPAFRMTYKDGPSMVTVGGVMPEKDAVPKAKATITKNGWPGFPSIPIIAPHLTLRETAALQAELPCKEHLNQEKIKELGFELEDSQIAAFQAYYRYYPSFAQITA